MEPPPESQTKIPPQFCCGKCLTLLIPLLGTLFTILFFEYERITSLPESTSFLSGWLTEINIDSTPYLLWFLLLPLFWRLRSPVPLQDRWGSLYRRWFDTFQEGASSEKMQTTARTWLLVMIVGMTSFIMSARIGADPLPGAGGAVFLSDLPPAFHDEFSYRFQAETFLAGRFSYPSHATHSELFNQMHVVNEGRFASRYFPGTGLWIVPFQAMGHPYLGYWLAGAFSAMLLFWAGRELGGDGIGFVAGMLLALSPGVALFSNLLLAHHPTLLGLMLFLFSFLRLMRTGNKKYALFAGVGLGFAMICRPMTAAGFGFPFGVWFFWSLIKKQNAIKNQEAFFVQSTMQKTWLVVAMGIPIVIAGALLLIQNRAITGRLLLSPYQVYNDTYTPRHVYGFNNVVRGKQHLAPKMIKKYDTWAKNLTPSLAWENQKKRALASLQWTLGLVPLMMAGLYFIVTWNRQSTPRKLIFSAIIMLHVVHIPYWFVGIMNWHYVFETAPLWLLIFAGVTSQLAHRWQQSHRPWMPIWWGGIIAIALFVAHQPMPPFWKTSRLQAGISEIRFARGRYYLADQIIKNRVKEKQALVLFQQSESDSSMDFVDNHPALQSQILRGHLPKTKQELKEIIKDFPERSIYLFRVDIPPNQWRCVPIIER
ncbi:hypothetical protein MNBD_PLANCTO02-1748 [hydrothermal vent metagenome]|uniref:Glycosyltransferase RgtA/B/C/D-like domain-containing protein n=1 Tax=hydrothermal vent metagenome TaxID=652676 RepID=A0A3B1E8U6_9ZZZZ